MGPDLSLTGQWSDSTAWLSWDSYATEEELFPQRNSRRRAKVRTSYCCWWIARCWVKSWTASLSTDLCAVAVDSTHILDAASRIGGGNPQMLTPGDKSGEGRKAPPVWLGFPSVGLQMNYWVLSLPFPWECLVDTGAGQRRWGAQATSQQLCLMNCHPHRPPLSCTHCFCAGFGDRAPPGAVRRHWINLIHSVF